MHLTWPIFRLVWSAAIVVYFVVSLIPGRMSRGEKWINEGLFVAVVGFVGIRILSRYLSHGGLIFQFALVFAGFAAAVGILFRTKALIARMAANDGE